MYPFLLFLHNILRWVVVILGIVVVALSIYGWISKREYSDLNQKLGTYFPISLDLQLIVGFLLYFVFSPITTTALKNFGDVMGNSDLRFFTIEHLLLMVIAIILAHVGSARVKKADTSNKKFKNAAIFFSLAFLLILAGIPWDRPLFRGF